jgi:DNA-directed RNA polymerase specialized sigma24 family protein
MAVSDALTGVPARCAAGSAACRPGLVPAVRLGYHLSPVHPAPGDDLRGLIGRVRDGDECAWAAFIDRFAPLILQAVARVERDRDHAADAFVHACERLRERHGARLATFDADREGSFENWLRAVAINLARDARRKRLGRLRPIALNRRLAPLEQRVLRLRHELGLTLDQVLFSLKPEFPGLTEARLAEADASVERRVSSRERWTLLTRRPLLESLTDDGGEAPPV